MFMNKKILLFGGTTEGRMFAQYLSGTNADTDVAVATEYGQQLLREKENLHILSGRKDMCQIRQMIKEQRYVCVIDATHPHAVEVTKNIQQACQQTNTKYYRLLRESCDAEEGVWVDSIEEAVCFLQKTTGNIFVTTGSKELNKFRVLTDFSQRVYARILPVAEAILQCQQYGMTGKHIICMQGPFSTEMNVAQLKQIQAKYIVTKESGKTGGFQQKIEAAQQTGALAVIIGRKNIEEGFSFSKLTVELQKQYSIVAKRQVTLLGIGAGVHTLTQEGRQAVLQADCIIGAKRMIEALSHFEKESFVSYESEKIAEFIIKQKQYKNIVVAFSGDIGYYSGAKKLYDLLKDFEVNTISGVSSVSYFMAKLHTSWEDAKLLSLHGKKESVLGHILQNKKTILLLGKKDDAANICSMLCKKGLKNIRVVLGENLSYDTEKITNATAEILQNIQTAPLAILYIENEQYLQKKQHFGMCDNAFVRGNVPMTKREVRTVLLSYMMLKQDDIIWDVGAGTGSVSVEMALQCPFGTVYAVEKKQKALLLLEENKQKWQCWNMQIIEGNAPEILKQLPAADKVFIGGSSGRAKEVMKIALEKNPQAYIIATAVTIETIRDLEESFSELDMHWQCTQIAVTRSENIGKYHMMKGQNPVWIYWGSSTMKGQ